MKELTEKQFEILKLMSDDCFTNQECANIVGFEISSLTSRVKSIKNKLSVTAQPGENARVLLAKEYWKIVYGEQIKELVDALEKATNTAENWIIDQLEGTSRYQEAAEKIEKFKGVIEKYRERGYKKI